MAILRIKDLTQTELEQTLKDKIKELRELEMEMEEMYRVGFHDGADNVEMIIDFVIEDIIEIENLLGVNHWPIKLSYTPKNTVY